LVWSIARRLAQDLSYGKSDARDVRGLLRARRERPSSRRAAQEHNELAPLHSITSSAATSSLSGTVRPSILAV